VQIGSGWNLILRDLSGRRGSKNAFDFFEIGKTILWRRVAPQQRPKRLTMHHA